MREISVLWHLHQPDYRDPSTGTPIMPWVRMHALRGYRDLLVEGIRHGDRWTLNVVPVLLDQLDDAARGVEDAHLALTRRPADALSEADRVTILGTFVCGNERMREAFAGYRSLMSDLASPRRDAVEVVRDLQVWSTLAWFGATAVTDHPAISRLRAKGRGFSEDDKAEMLRVHDEIIAELPGLFQAAGAAGMSFSVSPYAHPILPLLVDVRHAARCQSPVPRDVAFAWPGDAREQLVRARRRYEQVFGRAPDGLWPSEGAVSPEVARLAREVGFAWIATDDGVLGRSDGRRVRPGPGPWALGDGLVGLFRDHPVSDRIGFHHAGMPATAAADELAAAARAIPEGSVLFLALDGENPWEAFADAGAAWRQAVRERLPRAGVRMISADDAARRPIRGAIDRLHTGSWINADLRVWFGDPEDWVLWRALAAVRRAIGEMGPDHPSLPAIHAAEGSDWTWWTGGEFNTPFAAEFLDAFRRHLAAACRAAGVAVPPEVDAVRAVDPGTTLAPGGLVDPQDPFSADDWLHAGRLGLATGSMAQRLPTVRFGFAPDGALWVRITGERPAALTFGDVSWNLEDPPPDGVEVRGRRASELVLRAAKAPPTLGVGVGESRWVFVLPAPADDGFV
jgi:alpha-amylase/alpha-mannosidase (GH57 family)